MNPGVLEDTARPAGDPGRRGGGLRAGGAAGGEAAWISAERRAAGQPRALLEPSCPEWLCPGRVFLRALERESLARLGREAA